MWQTIVVLAVVAVAVLFVVRRLWRESREGSCECCDTCQGPPVEMRQEDKAPACQTCDKSDCKFE